MQDAKAQNLVLQKWIHSIGLPDTIDWSASTIDVSKRVIVTTNTLNGTEKANVLTTRYTPNGDVLWQKTYNGAANGNDYGIAVTTDATKNIYIAATTYTSTTNNYDYLLIKYDSSGTQLWANTYNGPGSFYDIPTDILVDATGNVYVTGGSYGSATLSDYCTIKYNASGTQQWVSRYNYASDQDVASGIAINSNGKIIVTGGSANSPGSWDFASIKYNPSTGAQLSEIRNSATGIGLDDVYSMIIDPTDNIYLTGRVAVTGLGYNMRTIKLDSSMSVVWSKNYDLASLDDEAHSIALSTDGNIYVTGWGTNADSTKSFLTLKYNSGGTLQWHKTENANNTGLNATGSKISIESYGNIIVTGTVDNGANKDFLTIIYNSAGTKLWAEQYDGNAKGDDTPNFVKADIDGNFYVGGKTWNGSSNANILIKYKSTSYTVPPDNETTKPNNLTYFENKGQLIDTKSNLRPDIKYYTTRQNPSLYFMDDTLSYVWSHIDTSIATSDTVARLDLSFYGSSSSKEIERAESQGGEYLNFYLAHCPAGVTNVRHTDRLFEANVYNHVDAEYYFDNSGIKYYLIIHPGYNSQQNPIVLQYKGYDSLQIQGDGKLNIKTSIGQLLQKAPENYQINEDGTISTLAWTAAYNNAGTGKIGFTLGTYNTAKDLVIELRLDGLVGTDVGDENINWSTIYGANSYDEIIVDCKYDPEGNPFIMGSTISNWFPTGTGSITFGDLTYAHDVYITKFDNHRKSAFGVVLGGSALEQPHSMDIKQDDGYVYVVGLTQSTDLYLSEYSEPGSYFYDENTSPISEGFIFRVSKEGNVCDWSTYIKGVTDLFDIDFDNDNEEFTIVGRVNTIEDDWSLLDLGSPAFFEEDPSFIHSAFSFIGTFNVNQIQKWGTKFWGADAVKVLYDVYDKLNVSGYSTNLFYFDIISESDGGSAIGYSGTYGGGELDPYFATFTHDKELIWACPYGGDGQDYITSIVSFGDEGDIYFIGISANNIGETAMTFPIYTDYSGITGNYLKPEYNDITDGTFHSYDGFITKFDINRNRKYSTLFGGDLSDRVYDAVYAQGGLWLSGGTSSDNTTFPYTPITGYYDGQTNVEAPSPNPNAFLGVLTSTTVLKYATYFGGTLHSYTVCIASQPITRQVLTAGVVVFNDDVISGFTPLLKPFTDSYFRPINPLEYTSCITSFITEWGVIPIVEEVNDVSLLNAFLIYPNPATVDVIIKSFNSFNINSFRVYDLKGRLVFSKIINVSEYHLDISKYAKGIYSIVFSIDNVIFTSKFEKQ